MELGFTGTRKGLTEHQKIAVVYLLSQLEPHITKIRHGDCIGADSNFHDICVKTGFYPLIETLPCNLGNQRAFSKAPKINKPKPPLDRNRDIALLSDVLLVCPGEDAEVLRSGTWMTCRTARKQGKKIIIVWPSGLFKKENCNIILPEVGKHFV